MIEDEHIRVGVAFAEYRFAPEVDPVLAGLCEPLQEAVRAAAERGAPLQRVAPVGRHYYFV